MALEQGFFQRGGFYCQYPRAGCCTGTVPPAGAGFVAARDAAAAGHPCRAGDTGFASGKCAPYEWPSARAWPAFAPTVRLAGGGMRYRLRQVCTLLPCRAPSRYYSASGRRYSTAGQTCKASAGSFAARAFCHKIPGGTLQQLPAPWQLSAEERACFAECFSGIGRAEAAQECERLGYYTARFEDYLQQARRTAQRQAGLPHRLGLAGGMMLALLFW